MLIGNGTQFSVAHMIAKESSRTVFAAFIALGDAALSAHDLEGRPVAFSVACLGSEEARMALADKGMVVLRMRAGAYATVAYALSMHGSDALRMKLIRMGMEVLEIDKGGEYSVAYALAASGSEEVQIALVSEGRKVTGIGRGGHLAGVAEALAWNGTSRVRDWLEGLGYDIEALFR